MRTIIFILMIFFAQVASAQVSISEIMYDPKDTDANSGGEWIEVQNDSSLALNLTEWFFFEDDTNHGITADSVSEIPPGGYAVISRDVTAFKNYFKSFSGSLFKASFSLNDGEKLAMKSSKDTLVNDINSVSYTSDQGAKNDGNSLQKVQGAWKAAPPTPGVGEAGSSTASDTSAGLQDPQGTTLGNEAVPTTATNNSSFSVEPQIFAKITAQTQTVSVGATVTFTGRVWGLKKEPIENARMVWAMGDGATVEGTSVSHIYYYPGEYTVILEASSGYYTASDRVRVVAVTPMLSLRAGGDEARSFVAIENRGAEELDLSGWRVEALGKIFTIPKNTFVGARKTLTLASEVTGLVTPKGFVPLLHFPNGTRVLLQDDSAPKEVKLLQNDKKPIVPIVVGNIVRERVEHASISTQKPVPTQTATVLMAFDDTGNAPDPSSESSESALWVWYVGVAFLASVALLGFRFTRNNHATNAVTADDFEIIDENENKKYDLF